MKAEALISEAVSLPVEERALVVESLLASLNKPESSVDSKWLNVAQKRLKALQTSQVTPLNGDQVFTKIWRRFNK